MLLPCSQHTFLPHMHECMDIYIQTYIHIETAHTYIHTHTHTHTQAFYDAAFPLEQALPFLCTSVVTFKEEYAGIDMYRISICT
jgi:hypothetical protein